MVALVACETLLLVLLVVLVAGLLRSHAEILRRLGPPPDEQTDAGSSFRLSPPEVASPAGTPPGTSPLEPGLPAPATRAAESDRGRDITGITLEGDAVKLTLGPAAPPTLLAFLSSGCASCVRFWEDLRDGPRPRELAAGIRLVAVTKDPEHESPSRLRELAPAQLPVVMSSDAWGDYQVPAAPYFLYLEEGLILGEGSATGWKQISSLLRDAVADHRAGNGAALRPRRGRERTEEVDRVLATSGIHPGDPSLYPGRAAAEPAADERGT